MTTLARSKTIQLQETLIETRCKSSKIFRTFYWSMWIVVTSVCILQILRYFLDSELFTEDLNWWLWSWKGFFMSVRIVYVLNLYVNFVYYTLAKQWFFITLEDETWSPFIKQLPVLILFTDAILWLICYSVEMGPAARFLMAFEQLRLALKMVSFTSLCSKNLKRRAGNKKHLYAEDEVIPDDPFFPSRGNFFYYLMLPTFIYRPKYPKIRQINWIKVVTYLAQMGICTFFSFILFKYCLAETFKNIGMEPLTWLILGKYLLTGCLMGPIFTFLIHLAFHHLSLDFMAEVTQFGDRQFYGDWWNKSTVKETVSMWNIVIYNFVRECVYLEIDSVLKRPKVSYLITYFLSVWTFDYVLLITFGFSNLWLWIPIGLGIPFLIFFLDPLLQKFDKFPIGSILPHIVIYCICATYSIEYYAIQNCYESAPWLTLLGPVPRFLNCFNQSTIAIQ